MSKVTKKQIILGRKELRKENGRGFYDDEIDSIIKPGNGLRHRPDLLFSHLTALKEESEWRTKK